MKPTILVVLVVGIINPVQGVTDFETLRTVKYSTSDCTVSGTPISLSSGGATSYGGSICYINSDGSTSAKLDCTPGTGTYTTYTDTTCSTGAASYSLGVCHSGTIYSCYSGKGFIAQLYGSSDTSCSSLVGYAIGPLNVCDFSGGTSTKWTVSGTSAPTYLYHLISYTSSTHCTGGSSSTSNTPACAPFASNYAIFNYHDATGAPTTSPSKMPTKPPTTKTPSRSPTSSLPSMSPSRAPSKAPSRSPSKSPSHKPVHHPSVSPSKSPSHSPRGPTRNPSRAPRKPSSGPSSSNPSSSPTAKPTTKQPSKSPTPLPTKPITKSPTSLSPTTQVPSKAPTTPTPPTYAPNFVASRIGDSPELSFFKTASGVVFGLFGAALCIIGYNTYRANARKAARRALQARGGGATDNPGFVPM